MHIYGHKSVIRVDFEVVDELVPEGCKIKVDGQHGDCRASVMNVECLYS